MKILATALFQLLQTFPTQVFRKTQHVLAKTHLSRNRQVALMSQRGRAMHRVCHQLQYCNTSTASSASDLTLRTLFCSVFVVVVQAEAAINIDSLMRRRRCTADCRSLCSQVQHIIDRQPSQLSLTIPICAFHTCIRRPRYGGPVGLLPWRLMRKKLEWFGYPMLKIQLYFVPFFSYLNLFDIE